MIAYIARRLVLGVPVLFGVSLLVFAMVHLVPGDPVSIMLGESPAATDAAALRHQLGLDEPLPQQRAPCAAILEPPSAAGGR